jgi:hypothetical protein
LATSKEGWSYLTASVDDFADAARLGDAKKSFVVLTELNRKSCGEELTGKSLTADRNAQL